MHFQYIQKYILLFVNGPNPSKTFMAKHVGQMGCILAQRKRVCFEILSCI